MEAAPGGAAAKEETVTDLLKLDDLKLEMGYALLPLVNGEGQDRLTDQIKALRRQLAAELGFVMPSVRILDNVQLDANAYVVRVKEIEAGTGKIFPGQFMAMDPMGGQVQLPGQHMLEPTFGLPATWIDASLRDDAQLKGYTVVDAATVVSTPPHRGHQGACLRASEPCRGAEADARIAEGARRPAQGGLPVADLHHRHPARAAIPPRRAGLDPRSRHHRGGHRRGRRGREEPRDVVEHVRARLGRQICAQYQGPDGALPIVTLSPAWEQAFADSIIGEREERYLAMQPSKLSEFVNAVRDRFESAARMGEMPVLVTSAQSRPFVRSIIERFRRETPVMSQAEIHPRARLRTVGSI